MKKAIFLDRDGTLNEDNGYTYRVEDFKLLPGVIEGLLKLKDYELFIISNQSGIGRGYYTEQDMHDYNDRLILELKKYNIKINQVYYCPHSPDTECRCRKPSTFFVDEAAKEYHIDIKRSYVIGDHPSDILLANNAGMNGIYLLSGHGVKHLPEARQGKPEYVAANFLQAAEYITDDQIHKIVSIDSASAISSSEKEKGKKVVTVNGTFDILHKGHEKILEEAKKQGDILIVGLNSDESVKQNKGPSRPINTEESRARMLARYPSVSYVVIFDEKTPLKMLDQIKPDVHVNGSEYGKDCIEREVVEKNGGCIHVVNLLEGYSTTKLIS